MAKEVEEIDKIVMKYYHELEDVESLNLNKLLHSGHLIDADNFYGYEGESLVYVKKAAELIADKHGRLTDELNKYRELKKGIKRTIFFHLKFWTM